jgi:hypothetical protein
LGEPVRYRKTVVIVAVLLASAALVHVTLSVLATLGSKSSDYLLFADGTLSGSIRAATLSAGGGGARLETVGASERCQDPAGEIVLDTAIGSVGRASRWDYLPLARNALEMTYWLPKSGYSVDIVVGLKRAFTLPGSLGEAAVFARGLANGSTPIVQLVQCPEYDVLTISKAY